MTTNAFDLTAFITGAPVPPVASRLAPKIAPMTAYNALMSRKSPTRPVTKAQERQALPTARATATKTKATPRPQPMKPNAERIIANAPKIVEPELKGWQWCIYCMNWTPSPTTLPVNVGHCAIFSSTCANAIAHGKPPTSYESFAYAILADRASLRHVDATEYFAALAKAGVPLPRR